MRMMNQLERVEEVVIRAAWLRIAVALGLLLATMLVGARTVRAEVSCYRTPAQAAVQVGEQEGGGYRLEFVRRDAFGGKVWATVRSCVHPEWPAIVVAGAAEAQSAGQKAANGSAVASVSSPQVLTAGKRVRVLRTDAFSRIEMSGIAQAPGCVGERVWVRILTPGSEGEQRLVQAVVRSAELLEMES